MSATITLSRLSWSLPDGRPLLSDIDLSFGTERTGLVGRNGVGKTTLLRLIAGESASAIGKHIGRWHRRRAEAGRSGRRPDETLASLFGVSGSARAAAPGGTG